MSAIKICVERMKPVLTGLEHIAVKRKLRVTLDIAFIGEHVLVSKINCLSCFNVVVLVYSLPE